MLPTTVSKPTIEQAMEETVVTVNCPELTAEQFANAPLLMGKRMYKALVHAHSGIKDEQPACGGIAFFYADKPRAGKPLDPRMARYLDGTTPKLGDPLICDTCKARLASLKPLRFLINR